MINDVTGGTYLIEYPSEYLVDIRKYHASQFYNWEQDNIPIIDLETRTNTLGAALGLFADDIPGVSMIVDGTDVSSSSRYINVATALALLPKTITFPVLIEVCSYGDLGDLALENFNLKGRGSLEIINRNYSADTPGTTAAVTAKINGVTAKSGYPWGSETSPSSVYSQSLWYDLSSAKDHRNDINCYSMSSWNNNAKFISFPHLDSSKSMSEPLFHVSGVSTGDFLTATTNADFIFSGLNYSDTTLSADSNPNEYATSGQTSFRSTSYHTDPEVNDTGIVTYAYANHFSKVKVENCKGSQIQIKGFCVDGGGLNSDLNVAHTNPVGFDIQNSDVVLTSCASFRNSDVGFRVANSSVLIEGGIVGHRNYPFDGSSRQGIDGVDEYDIWNLDYKGHGFEAYRSHITFDPDSDLLNSSSTSHLGKHGFVMSDNDGDGWHFDSCKISGGVGGHNTGAEQGAGPLDYQTTQITAMFNKGNGITFDDSQSTYTGLLRTQGNEDNGVSIVKSKIGVMGVISELNNHVGLKIESSEFVYNLGSTEFTTAYDSNLTSWETRAGHSFLTPAICVQDNGTSNLKIANNSKFTNYPLQYQGRRSGLIGGRARSTSTWAMQAANGNVENYLSVSSYEKGNLPLVHVTDNSYARLLGLAVFGDVKPVGASKFGTLAPVKGRAVSVTNNSKVDLYGTSAFCTVVTNSYEYADETEFKSSWNKAAIYAGDNSKIRISGPSKISQFGVATLAENNSTIEVGIALDSNGVYDLNLTPMNGPSQTQLDIQATRACMVVANSSNLDISKCGASTTQTSSINSASMNLADDGYHVSSYIQFYPHGFTAAAYETDAGKFCDIDLRARLKTPGALKRNLMGFDSSTSPNRENHASATTGGMCVRATGGSNVKVEQANFDVWVDCGALSGAYYNIEGSGNEGVSVYSGSSVGVATLTPDNIFGTSSNHYGGSQLQLWNIADNSRIVASNLTINGVDGSATDFHGPAGSWGSPESWSHNMGPLDYYGPAGAWQKDYEADASALRNYGPFRLLTGVNSDLMAYYEGTSETTSTAVSYGTASGLGGSPIAQINAQGYAAPGGVARPLASSDVRGHGLIEGAYIPSSFTSGPLLGANTAQPIFGARWGTGDSATNDRKFIANPMMISYDSYVPNSLTGGHHTLPGLPMFPNFPVPPLHMDWQGYLRNFFDESASNVFANTRHGASKMIKLCSIFRSHTDPIEGGEGRDGNVAGNFTFGLGVRSLNMFDLDKLI